jgi:hypothetical protein
MEIGFTLDTRFTKSPKPAAPNPAIAFRLNFGHYGRGVGDPGSFGDQPCYPFEAMSMLACPCGETISDNTDNLPYKGHLFSDTGFFGLFESLSRDIASYMAPRLSGTERQWLAEYFGTDTPMSDEELTHTIIARRLIHTPRLPGRFI